MRAEVGVVPALWWFEVRNILIVNERRRLSAYDAAYLELARREGLPLATLDGDLRKAAIDEAVALVSPIS